MLKKSLLIFSALLITGSCQISTDANPTADKKLEIAINFVKFISKAALSFIHLEGAVDFADETYKIITDQKEMSVGDAVGNLTSQISYVKENIEFLTQFILKSAIDASLKKITDGFETINTNYNSMRTIRDDKDYPLDSKQVFCLRMQNSNELSTPLRDIHNIIVGTENSGLIQLLRNKFETLYPCHTKSQQQYIYGLMLSTLTVELRGLDVFLYSTSNDTRSKAYVNNVSKTNTFKNESIERIQNIFEGFKNVLLLSSRTIQRCDLQKDHVKDVTYMRLENSFQRVIISYDANDACNVGCNLGSQQINDNNFEYEIPKLQNNQRGYYNLFDCKTPEPYDICFAKNQTSGRPRYQRVEPYIETKKSPKCDSYSQSYNDLTDLPKNNCFRRCECVCEENDNNSDKIVSLKEVTSNIRENYVVTGVRFHKINNVIYLQIKQGKLLPFGIVGKSEWVPVIELTDDERHSYNGRYRFHWKYSQGMVLETKIAPKNHVITGVKFGQSYKVPVNYREERPPFLRLTILVTEFDFSTGKLLSSQSKTLPIPETIHSDDSKRELFKPRYYEAPMYVGEKHKRKLFTDEYQLQVIQPTNLYSQDTGSSMVPYFDIQTVGRDTPLTALGVHRLGAINQNSGGYIALHAETLDISPIFSQKLTGEDIIKIFKLD